jgi:hypothetical protein
VGLYPGLVLLRLVQDPVFLACLAALVVVTPLLLSLLVEAVASFGGALLLGAAMYLAKRDRPPGALLHALHALELTRLPGLLSPRRQRYSPW